MNKKYEIGFEDIPMRIADLKSNDATNGEGISVSLWVQGCPFHCDGCFNQETWDYDGGQEIGKMFLIDKIIEMISADGITRNFSILGGEPLCDNNIWEVGDILNYVRSAYPDIMINVWTGYTVPQITYRLLRKDFRMRRVCDKVDYLICGPYEKDKRDISLKWRGSSNQVIWKPLTEEEVSSKACSVTLP